DYYCQMWDSSADMF
nr:immunoglobulin light chain junction region [Macaca mulatta]